MIGKQEAARIRQDHASASSSPMSALVYRSRAVSSLSPPDLLQLTQAAQARNRHEALTGVMLYDNQDFFQWLEGPRDSLDRVMQSIHRDCRHTNIEVLSTQAVSARTFPDCDMGLVATGTNLGSLSNRFVEAPQDLVEGLRRDPQAAPSLLAKLDPLNQDDLAGSGWSATIPHPRKTTDVLHNVMVSTVIPQLARQHRNATQMTTSRHTVTHPRARELADLLVDTDSAAALALIQELQASDTLLPLYASLFEPAARVLGDLWRQDDCSEFDVTLGLCRLQRAMHLLSPPGIRTLSHLPCPAVLVAPEPGEGHSFVAALDSNVLRQAGWFPHCEYPADDQNLQDLVATTWFDVLDLSLSPAFSRGHRLPDLAGTIVKARYASRNPALMVVVAGRAFAENTSTALAVGANLATTSSLGVDRLIIRLLQSANAEAVRH